MCVFMVSNVNKLKNGKKKKKIIIIKDIIFVIILKCWL